jgi:drug/metabolite transporter (DMT)-like permease
MHAPAARTAALDWRIALPFMAVTGIWGTTWYVITTQLGLVPAQWSVTYRFGLASLILFAASAVMGRRLSFPASAHRFFIVLGLFQFAMNFNFVYQAERHVTSGLIAVAFALLVVPNALLGRIFLGHRVNASFIGGSALGLAGIALLFRQELGGIGGNDGVIFGLAATGCGVMAASVANVMQATPRAKSYDMFGMLAWSMLYGAAMDAAFAWTTTGPPVVEWTARYIGGLLYLAGFASALAFVLYFNVIRQIGPAKAAYSGVLVPFIAMAVSTALEGYRWTGFAVAGAVLTLIGLVIALRARQVPSGTAAAGGTTGRT